MKPITNTVRRWPAKAPAGSTRRSEAQQKRHHLKMRAKGYRA